MTCPKSVSKGLRQTDGLFRLEAQNSTIVLMKSYHVSYGLMNRYGTYLQRNTCVVSMESGSESEALIKVKSKLNGSWKNLGSDVEVVILGVTPY